MKIEKLAPIPKELPLEPGAYNVVGVAKIWRSDPNSRWITSVLDNARAVIKGEDVLLTARDVADFMTSLALAKRRDAESVAQSYARLCSTDESMKALYAAYETLKLKGTVGKPLDRIPPFEEEDENEGDGNANRKSA